MNKKDVVKQLKSKYSKNVEQLYVDHADALIKLKDLENYLDIIEYNDEMEQEEQEMVISQLMERIEKIEKVLGLTNT